MTAYTLTAYTNRGLRRYRFRSALGPELARERALGDMARAGFVVRAVEVTK